MTFWSAVKEKLTGGNANSRTIVIPDADLKPIQECLREVPQSLEEDDYLALLMAIESGLVGLWKGSRLTEDSQARSIAEWLSRDSTQDPGSDELCREVQGRLKLFLNLNAGKYARRDVRNACNKILKSIDRHRDAAIPDAYLQFVSDYIP